MGIKDSGRICRNESQRRQKMGTGQASRRAENENFKYTDFCILERFFFCTWGNVLPIQKNTLPKLKFKLIKEREGMEREVKEQVNRKNLL